jgi:hypothetical protein
MTQMTHLRMMTVVSIRDPLDLEKAHGHGEDVDDALSGNRAKRDDDVAKRELRRRLNPSRQKTTMAQLTPERTIDL